MEFSRLKKEVYSNLPKMLEVVKASAIEKEMGVSSGWISLRLNHTQNGKYSIRRFTQNDVDKLNKGIWSLAEKLSTIIIPYSSDRAEGVRLVKEYLSPLFINKLAKEKLGWEQFDLSSRMLTGVSAKYRPQFTKNDIEQLTIGAREVSTRMFSVEYILSEE